MKRTFVATILISSVIAVTTLAQQKATSPEALLGAAIHQEEAEGNLEAAIASYKKFLAQYATNRPLAAKAGYHLGLAYEKLGKAEARKSYERVMRDYADQTEVAADARKHLAALNQPATSTAVVARQIWTGPDAAGATALHPEGKVIAMHDPANGVLATRDLSSGQINRLTIKRDGAQPGDYPWWPVLSPDLRQIVYTWYDGAKQQYQLRIATNERESKDRIVLNNPEVSYFEAAGWSPDGKSVLLDLWTASGTQQIAWVSVSDGSVKVLRSLQWRAGGGPVVSPDGRFVAYSALETPDSTNRNIYVVAADGSAENVVVKSSGINDKPAWTPDGTRLFFVSDRAGNFGLWSVAVRDGKAVGAPELAKPDFGDVEVKGFSRSGLLIYAEAHGGVDIFSVDVDSKTGRTQGNPTLLADKSVGHNTQAALSPDGKSVAFLRQGKEVYPGELVIRNLETSAERTYARGVNPRQRPIWFRDGKSVLLPALEKTGTTSFYRVDVKTGEFTLATALDKGGNPISTLSPDEKTLYTTSATGLLAIDLQSGVLRHVMTESVRTFALSPDGKTLGLEMIKKGENGQFQLCVINADGSGLRTLYTPSAPDRLSGRRDVAWSSDGQFLYFILVLANGNSRLMRISASGGTPEFAGLEMKGLDHVGVSFDGKRISFGAGDETQAELWSLDNLLAASRTTSKQR